jgi:hypothetical protein
MSGAFVLIALAMVLLTLLSPGNSARTASETALWWPGHAELSFSRIIEIGFSSTLRAIFMQGFVLPLLFFTLLTVLLARKWGPSLRLLLPLAPLTGTLLLGFNAAVSFITEERILRLNRLWESFTWYGLLRSDDRYTWFGFLLLATLLACAVVSVYLVSDTLGEAASILAILGLGFASKFILAFSPTVWASGDRTSTYLLFSFGLASLVLVAKVIDSRYGIISLGKKAKDGDDITQVVGQ